MILVTGATGKTGSELIKRLSARGVQVRGLVRSPAKAMALFSLPNIEIVEGDMTRPETLIGALQGSESGFYHITHKLSLSRFQPIVTSY